jgi:hypothetical protein
VLPNQRMQPTRKKPRGSCLSRSAVRRQGRAVDVARTQRWGVAGARAMEGVRRSDESGLGTVGRA